MGTIFCKGVFTIDTFNFVPHRDVKVSYQFNSGTTSFYSGAKQINRKRIRAEKAFAFKVSGLETEMRQLVAFYNAQHGLKDEFLFNYDGIEEHCFFADPITISAIREMGNIVGYEADVKLGCAFQVSPFDGYADTTDRLNITPKDKIEHKIDWNTKMVSMIFNARQKTFMEPTETFTVTLVGTKEQRDDLIRMFNLHGSKPFTFSFDGADYLVRFPDVIEITDKRSMNQIQGFESTIELEVIKTPNDGTYVDEDFDGTSAIIVKKKLNMEYWYRKGCLIDGVCYKDNLKKLQEYEITNFAHAFQDATDIYELPELDTSKCQGFNDAFNNSSVKEIKGLDFSNATNVSSMFYNSSLQYIRTPLTFPKATTASSMFQKFKGCRKIPYIKLPVATNVRYIFGSAQIDSIDGIYIPKVTSLDGFCGSSTIESMPPLDMNGKTSMFQSFGGCANLKSLRLINCNSLTSMDSTFFQCYELSSLVGLNMTKIQNDYRDLWTDKLFDCFKHCVKLKNLTIIEEVLTSTVDLANKYYSLLVNYGLLDGRYAARYIEHLIIVNGQGKIIERYDKYGKGRNDWR